MALSLIVICSFLVRAQSPYQFGWIKEGVIFGGGLTFALIGIPLNANITPLTIEEINNLSREDVNRFDRPATYNYSKSIADASDLVVGLCLALPATVLVSGETRQDISIIGVMYLETLLLSGSLPLIPKALTERTRPFVYNPNAPPELKTERNARRSFFSGHTTSAFAGAVFFSTLYGDYFPDSKWKPFVWGGSLLTASVVGYMRVQAGKHFPTDVLMGAAVGSAVGYLIPYFHRRKSNDRQLSIVADTQNRQVLMVLKLPI